MRHVEIDRMFAQLTRSLGTPRPPVREDELRSLFDRKDYNGMLGRMCAHMGLGMRLRVGLVNKGGPRDAPAWVEVSDSMPRYGTVAFDRFLVTVYLRKSFLASSPCGMVIVAMAHELSHIMLDGLRHELRRTEEAVDLTAMILGYRDVFMRDSSYKVTRMLEPPPPATAREKIEHLVNRLCGTTEVEIETRSSTVGYLTHEERQYAHSLM